MVLGKGCKDIIRQSVVREGSYMSNVITTNYFTMFLQIIVIRASTSVDANFPSILHTHTHKKKKKLLFLFYTPIFTKHLHPFIYSTHLFNKIFILLQFFIISSLTTPLSHIPNTTKKILKYYMHELQ